jgi:seryl-tRNA synthetase
MTTPDMGVPWAVFIPTVSVLLATIAGMFRFLYKSSRDSVVKLDSRVGKYFEAHERLRDKWDDFLRKYLEIDITRGQKVDALFRVVDQMSDTLKEIRPALNSKIEDSFARALSELKVYVRDQIREETNE